MDGWDDFYHENLIDNASDYRCNYKFAYEDPLHTAEVLPLQEEDTVRSKEEGLKLQYAQDESCQSNMHFPPQTLLHIFAVPICRYCTIARSICTLQQYFRLDIIMYCATM